MKVSKSLSRSVCCVLGALLLLAGCGGGADDDAARANGSAWPSQLVTGQLAHEQSMPIQDEEEGTGEALVVDDDEGPFGPSVQTDEAADAVAAKTLARLVPVYRFFNRQTGAHFYTRNETERQNIQRTMAHMAFEGVVFYASSHHSDGLSPVFRFYNTRTGVHFFTINAQERDRIVSTMPAFRYEGIAYYASRRAGPNLTSLYRFFIGSRGFHFYTASAGESNSIRASLPDYRFEGAGYYVMTNAWRPPPLVDPRPLPHTGVTDQQCFQSTNSLGELGACSTTSAVALSDQQDGHRRGIRPMSYAALAGQSSDDCVRDTVTGLVWEVKSATGPRSGALTYSNLGTGGETDSSGYVNYVNAQRLCGFSDWRMPTVAELLTLFDFGKSTEPFINEDRFPNTAASWYWSADGKIDENYYAWHVSFVRNIESQQAAAAFGRASFGHVRLVRGATDRGTRFSLRTVAYDGDSANNAVHDRLTGLVWRRCSEGQTWSGSTCLWANNAQFQYSHHNALVRARQMEGWRLPNIRELNSLVDRRQYQSAINPSFFPATYNGNNTGMYGRFGAYWSSTPWPNDSRGAWFVHFDDGMVSLTQRYYIGYFNSVRNSGALHVRLVRID